MTLPDVQLLNRENAILEFNRRVLAQAQRTDVPLLERLRYICIVSSNLDEFFEVRFADMLDAQRDGSGLVTPRDVERVGRAAHDLIDLQYGIFNDQVMPALHEHNIQILNHADRNEEIRTWVGRFFERGRVANKSLHFIARLSGKDALGRDNRIAIVKVPRVLPRVIKVPAAISGGKQSFVLLTSVIRAHLEELFPGRHVEAFSQFRVTRDSDLEVDEEEIANLRHALRSGLTTRHFGRAVRLEVVNTCPEELSRFLLEQFDLPEAALYRVNGPVNLVRLNELIDQTDADDLRFLPYEPSWPQGPAAARQVHPGQAADQGRRDAASPVRELRSGRADAARGGRGSGRAGDQADHLPDRQRVGAGGSADRGGAPRQGSAGGGGAQGPLRRGGQHQLGRAAGGRRRAGGVRDRRAEDACEAAAGHAPRGRQAAPLRASVDGQLQPQDRALLYRPGLSDGGCGPDGGHGSGVPATGVAVQVQGTEEAAAGAVQPAQDHVRAARPNERADGCGADQWADPGRAGGREDRSDRARRLHAAAGLPGVTDNILVRSVVGRFLEHSRIFYFRWGQSDEQEALYLSSADWMSRNMLRRIEVAWPVTDPKLRQRVFDEGLTPYLHDTLDSWQLGPDGTSQRIGSESRPDAISAQQALMRMYRDE
ncbi:polyphosphate kinase middle domain-containing protein [Ditylenchus destructor]|nr:polyphosphate kinase middle domain-containing protein [Ditylenchus destructor]